MIELTLQPVPLDEPGAGASPESAKPAAIEQTYFVAPVRLSIDGEDVLSYPGVFPDWRPIPVLGFASQLLYLASSLDHGQAGTISLDGGGVLSISRDDHRLVFTNVHARVQVSVDRDEVVVVAMRFAQAACEYVLSVAPAMSTHPAWCQWCPERS